MCGVINTKLLPADELPFVPAILFRKGIPTMWMNGPAHPVLPTWPRCVTSHIGNNEQRTVLQNIAHPNVNAREDVLFDHKHALNDMLDYVFPHNWIWAAQPLKSNLAK